MSRARDLSRLSSPSVFSVDATDASNNKIGIGSTTPEGKVDIRGGDLLVGAAITMGVASGIVSATAFYGDGSNLEGVASAGLGTALADEGAGAVIYYTDKVLGVSANVTVDVPDTSSSNVAYTQYEEISVDSGVDFIVADGDDFIPDILGISSDVQVPGVLAGGGGRVRADNFSNKAGNGAPTFSNGVVITGVATATSFSGDLTGNVTGNADTATSATNAQGLTGTPNITVGNITGVAATFTGVLTYEDVTNVDSVGIVTARGGLVTQKLLKEEVNVTAGKLSDNLNIYLENGCVHIFTTAESTTSTPAIKYSSGVNLKDKMSVGESVVVTLITTANASAYSAHITIDGDAVTENWIGGSAPSDGGSSGVDIHTFTIIKVASSGTTDQQLTVIANHSKTS